MPTSWRILNFILPPMVVGCALFNSSSWIPGTIALFIVLLYLPTFWTRVPYFPTKYTMYQVIADILPKDKDFSFIDLGCGGGALLSFLAADKPNGHFVGVDISPMAIVLSKLRALRHPNISIRFESFWKHSLADYDVVYAFLAPGPMPELWEKIKREMRRGSVFITNTFPVPEPPTELIKIDDSRQGALFIHRM